MRFQIAIPLTAVRQAKIWPSAFHYERQGRAGPLCWTLIPTGENRARTRSRGCAIILLFERTGVMES